MPPYSGEGHKLGRSLVGCRLSGKGPIERFSLSVNEGELKGELLKVGPKRRLQYKQVYCPSLGKLRDCKTVLHKRGVWEVYKRTLKHWGPELVSSFLPKCRAWEKMQGKGSELL